MSETFIRWDIEALLPGQTAVVADPPPGGETVIGTPSWRTTAPTLALPPLPGDPPPSTSRKHAVAAFLAQHAVEVVLVEYLDVADRWFDLLRSLGVRVWLRGHGVDVSARLREKSWCARYARYADADGITVPSRAAADRLIQIGLPPALLHVVPYAAEISRRPFGRRTTGDKICCAAVGRLVPKKAPLLTLEAFRLASAQDPRLRLDLVGDGPLMPDVQRFISDHSLAHLVRVHGSLPHVRALDLIRDADLFLHHAVTSPAGDAEGLPVVVLEAMAAGVPIVATAHEGIPDVITNGVHGRLVPEGDVVGMATVIAALASDAKERVRMGSAGQQSILETHTGAHCRAVMLELLGLTQSITVAPQ